MAYSFDQIFAADPSNPERVASNGVVTIFAPGDESKTPLSIRSVEGMIIPNPVQVNDSGHGPAFMHETLDRVAWEGGGFSGFLTSYEGMKEEAVAARVSAQASAAAAADAAAKSSAPTEAAIERAIATEGSVAWMAVGRVAQQAATEAAASKLDKIAAGDTFAVKPDNGGKPVGKGELAVNVKDYGATGDGMTDDVTAIRQALKALTSAGGGTLLFPPGTYNASAAMQVTDNVNISGYGATITRGFFGLSERGRGYGAGPRNVTIRGMRFLGSFTGTKRVVGMSWHHAQNITIEDCIFEQCIAWGHTFDLQGCDGVAIRNNTWLGFDPTQSPHSEAIQCDISALSGASVAEADITRYDALPTRNVLVEHNQFLPLTVGGTAYPCPNPIGSHGGVEGAFYDNITFRNNVVRHPTSEHDWYPGAIHFIGARGLKIHDNTFEGLPGVSGVAISLNNGRYVIRPSEVGQANPATHVSDNPVTARNISIRGNVFNGWTAGSSVIDITGDARGHYAKGLDIRENEFREGIPLSGTAPAPLLIRWAESVHVVGNSFARVRRIGDFGDSRGVQIDSNTLTDCVSNGVYAVRMSGLQITANEMRRISIFLNLDQVDGLLVANNGFEEGAPDTGYGILNAITAGIMTLNRVRGASSLYGFSWRGATSRSQCRNNIVDSTITKGVDVVSPAVVDVGGNI